MNYEFNYMVEDKLGWINTGIDWSACQSAEEAIKVAEAKDKLEDWQKDVLREIYTN